MSVLCISLMMPLLYCHSYVTGREKDKLVRAIRGERKRIGSNRGPQKGWGGS